MDLWLDLVLVYCSEEQVALMMKFDLESEWGELCVFIKLFMEIRVQNDPIKHNTNNIEQTSYGGLK